jgi:hypothetical protein
MFTPPNKLEYFKFQYSRNANGSRFSNTVVDKLPQLSYRFAEGNNWTATDNRINNKWEEMDKWFQNYWNLRNKDNRRNDVLFEEELEQAILNAYESLKDKWVMKLEKEFEYEFEEDVVKFLNSKNKP